jgi:hypothetical protein
MLTNLTQGVAQEPHRVDYDPKARPLQIPDIVLKRRPVRRVSLVSGFIEAGGEDEPPVAYTFSLNDYELVPDAGDPADLSRIRFLPFGKKPAPGTTVTVNYYPRTTDPTPITDVNVGSVARTLVEAVSRELAVLYTELNLAYDSAFLETAEGVSLDRVVGLLGYQRFRAGRPVGAVTFRRRPGSVGNITIPAGTPITDAADKIRYETITAHDMLAGESTAEVRIRGASQKTEPVKENTLTVIQQAIAGLESVTNERPTTRASDDESDAELRQRARVALLASNKGTVPAIQHGLLQIPEVRDVKVVEMPNGVPGEISLTISMDGSIPDGKLPDSVLERIEQLRPAGVRILANTAASLNLQANLKFVLAGSQSPAAEIAQIHAVAREKLIAEIRKRGVGEKIRNRPLTAALLSDDRIVDVQLTLSAKGGAAGSPGADFQPDTGVTVQLAPDDVSFAPDTFDQPLPSAQQLPVEVRATIAAQALTGVPIDSVKEQINSSLKDFFTRLSAGTTLQSDSLLTALRDDTKYAIDPLRLTVTLTSDQQFVQITQGGPTFQVGPKQTFTIVSVEVTA